MVLSQIANDLDIIQTNRKKKNPISNKTKIGIYLVSISATFYIYKKLNVDDNFYRSLVDRTQGFYKLFGFLDIDNYYNK